MVRLRLRRRAPHSHDLDREQHHPKDTVPRRVDDQRYQMLR